MIRLSRIGMVNWHRFPPRDIDVDGNVALVGENASGKSTVLDLIQTVMSGNSGRYLDLNARAGDGKRKGRRTVQSYILGRVAEGPEGLKRKEALCTVFLTFDRPDGGPVTLGVVMEARAQDAKETTLARFIADGVKVSVEDLVETTVSGDLLTKDWGAVVQPWLDRACRDAGGQLIVHRDPAIRFVNDYLKMLSTGRLPIASTRFLRAFGNAVRLQKIESATTFVRDFILEEDDLRITELRDSIQDYRGYAREIALLREKLAHLTPLTERIAAYAAAFRSQDIERWAEARARALAARITMAGHQRQARLGKARLGEIKDTQDRLSAERRDLEEEREGVNRQILAATTTQRMGELRMRRVQLESGLKDAQREIQAHFKVVVDLVDVTRTPEVIPPPFARILDTLRRLKTDSGADQPPQWPRDPAAIEGLINALALDRERLVGVLGDLVDGLARDRGEADRQVADLTRRIGEIQTRGFSIRPEVEDLRAALRGIGIPSRLLCEQLEVVDETWRLALEVLLGRDREAILVEREHVEAAIRFLQDNRREYRGCRVANSRKLTPGGEARAGTLASMVRSKDPLAMAFVLRRLGNVRLADTIADLHAEGRAVMRDGTYDDGLTVEVRQLGRNDGHKIGANAGRNALGDLERERDGWKRRSAELLADRKRHDRVIQALRGLETLAERMPLSQAVDRAARTLEELDAIARATREEKDLADPALRDRLEVIKAQLETYREEEGALNQEFGEVKRTVGDVTGRLAGGEQTAGSRLQVKVLAARYKAVLASVGAVRALGGLERFRAVLAKSRDDLTRSISVFGEERRRLDTLVAGEGPSIMADYGAYKRLDGGAPEFIGQETILGPLAEWVTREIETIEANSLKHYEDLAKQAAERAEYYFQTAFIHELRERFSRVDDAIEGMTLALKDHPFHNDRYRFRHEPAATHREIWNLVEGSRENDSLLLPLFREAEITEGTPHGEALRKVRSLLLEPDFDITDHADYRNYFVFDMEMIGLATGKRSNLESRQGTGSGAEQQTPYYVAIGASLATLYHRARRLGGARAREDLGIGLVVLDEAFSNMDPKNVRAAFEYYRDLGLQVLVAAPYDKRSVLLEMVDTVVDVWKEGDDYADVEATYPGERLREELAQRNPGHYDITDFRRLLDGGGSR
jgi:energy-coupling factor transporter ATP-binding protein EcfA2